MLFILPDKLVEEKKLQKKLEEEKEKEQQKSEEQVNKMICLENGLEFNK